MRKMIVFIVVFFVVDRFMNYKLDHCTKKNRIVAHNNAFSPYLLPSEKKERASSEHKKIIVAQHNKKLFRVPGYTFSHSSKRNA